MSDILPRTAIIRNSRMVRRNGARQYFLQDDNQLVTNCNQLKTVCVFNTQPATNRYPITPGRIEGHGRRGKPLTADYVLVYRNRKKMSLLRQACTGKL